MNALRIRQGALGVRTGNCPRGVDPLAGAKSLDSFSDHLDDPPGIRSGRVGERLLAVVSGANVGVDRIDPGRLDPNQDLPRTGAEVGYVFQAEDLRPSELMNANRFHGVLPFVDLPNDFKKSYHSMEVRRKPLGTARNLYFLDLPFTRGSL